MISVQNISIKIAHYLCKELELDRRTEITMVFGLELLLGAVIKTFFIGSLAAILGIFPETMVLVFTAGFLRIFSGGEHCQAFYRCLFGGGIVYLLLGLGVHFFKVVVTDFQWTINIVIAITAIVVVKHAPADTANRRITDRKEKIKYKIRSLLVVSIIWGFILIIMKLRILSWLVVPVLTGLLWQSFTITPWGYKFIRAIDKLLAFKKEVTE